jgi:hypothetical protein
MIVTELVPDKWAYVCDICGTFAFPPEAVPVFELMKVAPPPHDCLASETGGPEGEE